MKMSSLRTKASCILAVIATVLLGGGVSLRAQAVPAEVVKPAAPSQPTASTYTAEQVKGRALFIQNCSYCHLARNENPKNSEPGKSVGPSLKGIFGGPKPMPEAVARGFILKGTTKMPGFQYSFTAAELDNLIAYLKAQ